MAISNMATRNEYPEVQSGDQLLPGIPDEISIDKIGPKLPWTAFHILSCVSRAWLQAIKRGTLYDARVRSQSTQRLVAFLLQNTQPRFPWNTVGLYSANDCSSYQLPPIPDVRFGIPGVSCKIISLDGKVYVLGGFKDQRKNSRVGDLVPTAEVYVKDLSRQGKWKQCASMRDPRACFGCGVVNGKIYVFGGVVNYRLVCASEVYDPTKDAWSPIARFHLSFRCHQHVTTVGEELFVHNGDYDRSILYLSDSFIRDSFAAAVYQPLKNVSRIVEDFTELQTEHTWKILAKERKLQQLAEDGIEVYYNNLKLTTRKPSHYFNGKKLRVETIDLNL